MAKTAITSNYIYLLQEREFIKTGDNIYKIGRTKKENCKRFNQYPNGSILLFQIICMDCESSEKHIISLFKEKFEQQKEIGNEYFRGNYKKMIDIIYNYIKNEPIEEAEKSPQIKERKKPTRKTKVSRVEQKEQPKMPPKEQPKMPPKEQPKEQPKIPPKEQPKEQPKVQLTAEQQHDRLMQWCLDYKCEPTPEPPKPTITEAQHRDALNHTLYKNVYESIPDDIHDESLKYLKKYSKSIVDEDKTQTFLLLSDFLYGKKENTD